MDRELTERQRRFVNHYVDTGNGAEAVRRSGYKDNRPDQQAYENLRKPEIKAAIKERMDRYGITEEKLLNVLNDGLSAEKHDNENNTQPDYHMRHRYLETALKLRSMFPSGKEEVSDGLTIIIEKSDKVDVDKI